MLHLAFAMTAVMAGAAEPSTTCEKLAGLSIQGVSVLGAETIGPGAWKSPGGEDLEVRRAVCRVRLLFTPSTGSSIQAEVWMPVEGWNGRFLGTGNGSYGGVIDHRALANGVARGFATANDDMGTVPAKGRDGSPLIGLPVKWLDFGWRATHTTAEVGKRVVASFYGRKAQHAYLVGCSSGGRQALMEAQRFPEDYDGIVAGCAARQQTRTIAQVVWLHRALRTSPESLPTPEKFQSLRKAVLAACAPTDSGPSGDAWLVDPAACKFDPDTIRCKEADGPECLSAAQVEVVRKIYAGPRNPRTGAAVYPGLPPGGEAMYRYLGFVAGQAQPPWDGTIRWAFGAQWDPATFDFDRDQTTLEETLGALLDASSSDLTRFAKRGGKLILWHGWMDAVNPTGASLDYYRQVVAAQRGGLAATKRFARLFLAPGVGHCAGGPGADGFGAARPAAAEDAEHDMLLAVVRWVEQGVAPSRIVASKFVEDDPGKGVVFQRPLCPYPEVARYRGEGEPTAASNFTCRAPR